MKKKKLYGNCVWKCVWMIYSSYKKQLKSFMKKLYMRRPFWISVFFFSPLTSSLWCVLRTQNASKIAYICMSSQIYNTYQLYDFHIEPTRFFAVEKKKQKNLMRFRCTQFTSKTIWFSHINCYFFFRLLFVWLVFFILSFSVCFLLFSTHI